MIISLNAMDPRMKDKQYQAHLSRPDLTCTGLLINARGQPEPSWWSRTDVQLMRQKQDAYLSGEIDWRLPAARLLGLDSWPDDFDNAPSSRSEPKVN